LVGERKGCFRTTGRIQIQESGDNSIGGPGVKLLVGNRPDKGFVWLPQAWLERAGANVVYQSGPIGIDKREMCRRLTEVHGFTDSTDFRHWAALRFHRF
jgi:hypothetical protein